MRCQFLLLIFLLLILFPTKLRKKGILPQNLEHALAFANEKEEIHIYFYQWSTAANPTNVKNY
jgi:hypothetical protein